MEHNQHSAFQSFFMAGFECATQRHQQGNRLDLLSATGHDRFARQDFIRLRQHGISTARSGIRWHLIETSPYHYDFSSLLPYLRIVREQRMQIVWDYCHYGYPDDIDPFSPEFVRRFRHFARAVTRVIAAETKQPLIVCPINEPSFWSWAGGEVGYFNPHTFGRGFELKQQFVRAMIAAIDGIREAAPDTRITAIDPLVHITHDPARPHERWDARGHHQAQYQTFDMLYGLIHPELGGNYHQIDLIGVNYYGNNQWFLEGRTITPADPQHRPFSSLAREIYERYRRPLFIAETGCEGDERPTWLRTMMDEIFILFRENIPVEGLCLYPILDYPGWDNERHCPTGLWGYADETGKRPIYTPLADELSEQQIRLTRFTRRKLAERIAAIDKASRAAQQNNLIGTLGGNMLNIVVISHLRWDFVWQRPQHLLSRMGRDARVIFVEEPIASPDAKAAHLDIRHEPNNVTVVRLIQPVDEPRWIGHNDPLTAQPYQALLKSYLRNTGIERPAVWLYTPVGWHFVDAIPHELVIYDVMDELSAFKGASPQLRYFDELALSKADVVFTGGLSMYQRRRDKNPNIHLFASGVEIEHFATAARRETFNRPADLNGISAPILGYYGVIDERMDLQLLAHVAASRPDWNIVMLGPTAKIDPNDLPKAPNLHFLGMKSYQELPAYLAYFDVALIPFACCEATRYLSPTKTLEYMAAHKPIVSTPIPDIAAQYSQIVRIAHSPEEFEAQVEAALKSDPNGRRETERRILAQHTWDSIAARMKQIIIQAAQKQSAPSQEFVYERQGA